MASHLGPNIVTAGMSYNVDAANTKSLNTIDGGWRDLMGNRPTANFSGTGTFSVTFYPGNGGVINFTGTQSSVATVNQSFFSTGSRTFDVWVKRDTIASTYSMVWGLYVPYLSMYDDNKFLFAYYRNEGASNILTTHYSNQSIVNGRWYNVTCTIEYTLGVSTVSKMYINGVLDRTLGWNSPTASNINPSGSDPQQYLILGGWHSSNPNTPLRGSISNFRIYERVLTDAEILQNYYAMAPRFAQDVSVQDIIFYVDAGNSVSFTSIENGWKDLTRNQATLPISGASYDPDGGGSLAFNSISGSASTSTTFTQYGEMTWSVWFKRTTTGVNRDIVWANGIRPHLAFNSSGQFEFHYATQVLNTSTITQRFFNSGFNTLFANNVWYNVTCTLIQNPPSGLSTAKMYVNGTIQATDAQFASTKVYQPPTSPWIKIANHLDGANPFNGKIANHRVFKRALTDTEILNIYNEEKSKFGY